MYCRVLSYDRDGSSSGGFQPWSLGDILSAGTYIGYSDITVLYPFVGPGITVWDVSQEN